MTRGLDVVWGPSLAGYIFSSGFTILALYGLGTDETTVQELEMSAEAAVWT